MTTTYLKYVMRDTICMILVAVTFSGFMKFLAFIGTIWTLINAFVRTKQDVKLYYGGSWKKYFKNFFKIH